MALTDTFVKTIKPTGKPTGDKYADGKGMYLYVKEAGKYWRMDYRYGEKRRTLALGVYPSITLAMARKKGEVARELLADGVDPMETKRETKQAQTTATQNTFRAIALEWHIMKTKSGKADTTVKKLLSQLENHVFPEFGNRPITAVKPKDVLAMLQKVAAAGTAYTAGRLREICGQVFRFAIVTGRAEVNPTAELRGAIETPATKHLAALTTYAEFGQFVRDLRDYSHSYPITKLAARFALLTWTRSQELRRARWEQFDVEAKVWRVPAVNMKNGKHLQAFTVSLSVQALQVLEQIREISGGVPFLFPGNHGADSVMSENTINGLFKKMGYKDRQTHHGLRASARSLLSERGWLKDALERQLDHFEANMSVAAYARGQHLDERRKFMADWGKLVASLESGDNVIPLPLRHAA